MMTFVDPLFHSSHRQVMQALRADKEFQALGIDNDLDDDGDDDDDELAKFVFSVVCQLILKLVWP